MSRPISMALSQNGCDHASISTDQCHFTLLKKGTAGQDERTQISLWNQHGMIHMLKWWNISSLCWVEVWEQITKPKAFKNVFNQAWKNRPFHYLPDYGPHSPTMHLCLILAYVYLLVARFSFREYWRTKNEWLFDFRVCLPRLAFWRGHS